jgi:hypothetical protein
MAADCTPKFPAFRPFFGGGNGASSGFAWPAITREGTMPAHLTHQALAQTLIAALAFSFPGPSPAAAAERVKIAVFDFELNDTSAAGGLAGPDAHDA